MNATNADASDAGRSLTGTKDRGVRLSVIVPAHNSALVIDDTVRLLAGRLAGTRSEIIVVENGSSDDTHDRCVMIEERWTDPTLKFTVLRSGRGMGNALRTGILASVGDHVLLTADDLPFGFGDLDQAETLLSRSDGARPALIIGSKAHRGSRIERGRLRSVLTWGFSLMRRLVLGMRTGDPQGTFVVEGELLRDLAPRLTEPGFLFTTELAYVLERRGVRPVEVPVTLAARHREHQSRVRMWDVVQMGAGLLRLRRRHSVAMPNAPAGREDPSA